VLLVSNSFFCLIKLYFSKILSHAGSYEDLDDSVVYSHFLDEEVDTMCWLPETTDECGPSITMVD
jgi:hypothetical protein